MAKLRDVAAWKAKVFYDASFDDVGLMVRGEGFDGKRYALASVQMVETVVIKPDQMTIPSETGATQRLIQAIVDAAWEFGVRPTGYVDERAQVKEMTQHIDDLREVFRGLLPKIG